MPTATFLKTHPPSQHPLRNFSPVREMKTKEAFWIVALVFSIGTGCASTIGVGTHDGLTPSPIETPTAEVLTSPSPRSGEVTSLENSMPQRAMDIDSPHIQTVNFESAACSTCPRDDTIVPQGYAMPMPPTNTYGIDPQEFLCNGGDRSPGARVRRDDSMAGVNVSDAVVHYTTEAADIEVRSTNQVCLYAPRFKSVRHITGAVSGDHSIGLGGVRKELAINRIELNEGGVVIGESVQLGHADVTKRIDAMRDRNRGVRVDQVLQPEQAADVLALLINLKLDEVLLLEDQQKALLEELSLAAVAWAMDESVEVAVEDLRAPVITRDQSVEGFVIYEFPEAGRLQISKLADRSDALPGESVQFAISVRNVGDSPVDHIVITDNLTTRLEYVEESQTCSAGAQFDTERNDSQSLRLTWELTDKLRVGESATIRFRCKVR